MIPVPVIQVWNETGSTALGVLADVLSIQISDVFGDLGSMQVEFPRNGQGASLLDVDADRQLKVMFPGVPALWYLNDDDTSTWVSDAPESEPVNLTCRSLAGLLEEAVVLPPDGIGTTPTEYGFTDPTPGEVVATLFTEAQGRGLLQGLTLSGSATLDASGVAWPATIPTVAYSTGTTLLDVVKGLASVGVLEWRMNGRALELHRPGGGLDRTLGVTLRPRRDVLSAPLARSRRSIATAVVIEGDGGSTSRRTQTLTGRRAREEYVSDTNVPDTSLDDVGDLYLAAHAVSDLQLTHDVTDGDDTPVPFRDYRAGDRVGTIAAGSGVTVRRVAQVALSMSADETKATLELGSILKSAEEQFALKLQRLAPGDPALT